MSVFNLPDLGEGLPDAEIVEWHVKVGDEVKADQPLASVETAKAIVEIPSPQGGKIAKLYGEAGEIVRTGDPLLEFDSGEAQVPKHETRADAGTVVGEVRSGQEVVKDKATGTERGGSGVKATPAVRALARRLEVDLSIVTPGGPGGSVTSADVERAAKTLSEVGPIEPLRGARRAMARTMAMAHAEVVAVTVNDDADIDAWEGQQDPTLRLVRAIVAGCKAEPALNAWYDGHAVGRRVLEKIHLGIAVDTDDGLFVPMLRDIANREMADLRKGLDTMKAAVTAREVPPEELRGHTFTLSNFGTLAGRYADPIVVPPTVAILGAGRIRAAVVAADGQPAVHRILPLSLTFDHRAVTGGEATRFLAAAMNDLGESA